MLPQQADFEDKAAILALALHEFVTIERHVELNEWKRNPRGNVLDGTAHKAETTEDLSCRDSIIMGSSVIQDQNLGSYPP